MHTRRNRLRARHLDYGLPPSYLVTVRVRGGHHRFGRVVDGRMELSRLGSAIQSLWTAIPSSFRQVRLDAFVVMPNHLHGILVLCGSPGALPHLGTVVGSFKSRATHVYRRGARRGAWPALEGSLWQRSYHDRVLRDEEERAHAVGYIVRNPRRWDAAARHDHGAS